MTLATNLTVRSTASRMTSLVLVAAAVTVGLGCSGARVSFTPEAPTAMHTSTRTADSVEALLDEPPTRPHDVIGEFNAASVSNSASIEAMRAAAAREGLDGIYWIDCTSSCSGRCTAKGFVYSDASVQIARR